MTLLQIDALCAGYGQADVLSDVSLSVDSGEIVGLVGANGAGKTTLLRTISGLIRPRAGSIVFEGSEFSHAAPHEIVKRGLSHVPEGRGVLADMPVRDNLRLGAYIHGSPDPASLDRIFGWFPILRERLHQMAGTLSGGEQQMLAISRSILSRPRLLIVDELSLGLAPKIAGELLTKLADIRAAGTSLMIVDQNVRRLLDISDRVYVLAHGRIVFAGDPHSFRQNGDLMGSYLGID